MMAVRLIRSLRMLRYWTKERQRVKTKNIAGDKGLYTVPAKLQGEWYSMDNNRRTHSKYTNQLIKIEFGTHTLTTEDHQYEIHILDKEYFEKHQQFSNDYLNCLLYTSDAADDSNRV